ncbi:phage tail sheath gpL-like [Agrobacterium vitis]|nr:phage tail sheath gpL-like [Agrobacterium vitis]MBE1437076.1 phage tail sheath gpL-like [Agrobacterium vitis]
MVSNIPDNIVAPLLAFDVESGGQFSSQLNAILIGFGTGDGALGEGEISICSTFNDARRLAGAGSMLESMFIRARQNAPAQVLYIGRVADTGTAEVRTITVGAVPATGGTGVVQVAGETVSIDIAAGDSANAVAEALAAAINGYFNALTKKSLPFTAVAAANVVTLTARHKGLYAGKLDLYVPLIDGDNALTGVLTFATTVAGAGTPDVSTVLAALGDDPFEIIISGFGDTANLSTYKTFLEGRWGYSQQLYGHVFYPYTGTDSALTTFAKAKDTWHLTMVPLPANGGMATPDYEFCTAMIMRTAAMLNSGSDGRVSANQSGLTVAGVLAPRDRNYWPDYATRNAWLQNSVSSWKIDNSGDVVTDKIITQQQTTNGAPDTVFRDIQAVYQVIYALKYFRAQLAYEFSNKAIVDDNPASLESLVTVKNIKACLVHSTIDLANRGVLEYNSDVVSQIKVTRNADNPNKVDIVLPMDRANPLDIFAGLARVYAQI